jgi:hypothetical protein
MLAFVDGDERLAVESDVASGDPVDEGGYGHGAATGTLRHAARGAPGERHDVHGNKEPFRPRRRFSKTVVLPPPAPQRNTITSANSASFTTSRWGG